MKFLAWIVRRLLQLRYQITVKGLDSLDLSQESGILFLPNHPAEIDPVILTAWLMPRWRIRPLVVEKFFRVKWIAAFFKLVKALPLPDMDIVANQWKSRQIAECYDLIKKRLSEGDHFLIYPAGHLKFSGLEVIGGASLAHQLVNETACQVVLIRTTGLWGSSFSRYASGVTPPFSKMVWEGFKTVLKNGLFFTPRREVLIEFEKAPKELPKGEDRLVFNRFLEEFYNARGIEPVSLVSYSFFKKELLEVTKPKDDKEKVFENKKIPEAVKKPVLEFIAKIAKRPESELTSSMKLSADLGLDSLNAAEIHAFLGDRFNTPQLSAVSLQTVGDVLRVAAGYFAAEEVLQQAGGTLRKPLPQEKKRFPFTLPVGKTLQEAFITACKASSKDIACVDLISGPLSYQKLLIAALALSEKIRKISDQHVGIMLPATSGSYIVILATLLAGKIPVMLNWTAGKKSLEHAQEVLHLKTVFSSSRFLERLDDADFGSVYDLLSYLEEVRGTISLGSKLKALWLSLKSKEALFSILQLEKIQESDTAVILFTSGTESLPKGVPLTHGAILFDQRAALSLVKISSSDRMYCVLPPFHSFGFCITGLIPLFTHILAIYAPNPTDAKGMAEDISFWKASIFCSAPSFIKTLFFAAKKKQLQSLQLIVSGAEKMPEEIPEYCKKNLQGAQLIEGYGVTECSPIVTLQRPQEARVGVGPPIPGVTLKIVDPESLDFLSQGQEGEVWISGKNVFNGYLGTSKDPFFTKEGQKWYRSGDRGFLTKKGELVISGRYKRFMKVGGEMISLGGLEEDVLKLLKEKNKLPASDKAVLAIGVAPDAAGVLEIVLFTTFDLDLNELNHWIREQGHARVTKIARLKKVEEIPLMGTGKINHRKLEENA